MGLARISVRMVVLYQRVNVINWAQSDWFLWVGRFNVVPKKLYVFSVALAELITQIRNPWPPKYRVSFTPKSHGVGWKCLVWQTFGALVGLHTLCAPPLFWNSYVSAHSEQRTSRSNSRSKTLATISKKGPEPIKSVRLDLFRSEPSPRSVTVLTWAPSVILRLDHNQACS